MKKIVFFILGVFLIATGIVGCLIPVLPGWPFLFLGLSFIAPKLAERLKQRFYRKFSKKEVVYLEDWKKSGVDAGFTTRHFPLSVDKTERLLSGDVQKSFADALSQSTVLKNHHVKPMERFVFLDQAHGGRIAVLDDASPYRERGFYRLPQTDGALTNIPDLALLVLTADCLSVFFRARDWVGLVHAGWKGAREKIAQKAFRMIVEKSGCGPKNVRVVFGPCIGADRYEVGPEFKNYFIRFSLKEKNEKIYFDLAKENKRQLIEAGAVSDRIFETGICTISENENFYSFRKEKEAAGRIVSFIVKR